ncbi:MAG: hypothetical protein IJH39_10060 [Clostridia bacterium]|nr:hypothetical protein [Clostridia bacterium]
MNNKKIRNYQIFSIVFTFLLGSFLHFTYELSGKNYLVATFSAINESVWEHLKILYFPMLLTIIIGCFYLGKEYSNFLCSKTIGTIIAMIFIVVFFYTYFGILGKNIAFIDILSFFIADILGEVIAYISIINKYKCNRLISILVLILISILFIIFTFFSPRIGLFKDPVTGTYGI